MVAKGDPGEGGGCAEGQSRPRRSPWQRAEDELGG